MFLIIGPYKNIGIRDIKMIKKYFNTHKTPYVPLALAIATITAGMSSTYVNAQEANKEIETEEVVVTGIRASLENALQQKRASSSLIEVIEAVDIGKLPDQNLAEVLENVPGVQITRTAGVGTGVQIRGTNSNRTEINGVSTVGSGSGRSGISFEDVSASMIAGVEVIKSPEAKTIEGSVGGTINLKTIRPLDLKEPLGSIRLQGEDSNLSTDGITPRLSGTWGNNWSTDYGEFGAVISASYTEADVTAFRPRADRDNSVASDSGLDSAQDFDFLPIQFFVQDYDNLEFETKNFSGSFEWAPNESVKLYFDTVINDQERLQESSRVQASGVSDLIGVSIPSAFETVDLGTLDGENGIQDLGSIAAATQGIIPVEDGGADPNLRLSTDTSSRITESKIFRLGGEWEKERFSGRIEISQSTSDSQTPSFDTTLNFLNPNVALNQEQLLLNHQLNEENGNDDLDDANENGTPFIYDLTGGSLAFGIAFDEENAPTTEQLLDPENYVLRDVNQSQDITENQEDAFVFDISYDMSDFSPFITSIDTGYRYSKSSSLNDESSSNFSLRDYANSPTADLFESILVAGPDNFNAADGRELFVRDFLLINPELVLSDPNGVLDILNDAIVANNAITGVSQTSISSPTSTSTAFFDIEEKTDAFYLQANFEHGIYRGNFGFRYLETKVKSVGNAITEADDGTQTITSVTTNSDYDFLLPRINLAANVSEDVLIRAAWSKDIRRPDFDDLSTSTSFSTSPNTAVSIGNSGLIPEEVTSYDIGVDWYFAPSAVVSLGYFNKSRTGLHVTATDGAAEDSVTGFRDITGPECEDGGIFNPIADINVFGPDPGVGVCVDSQTTINGAGETKQEGFELAVQYDLSSFEDQIGWASGFGVLANYTKQEFTGGDEFLEPTGRAETIFALQGLTDVTSRAGLLDLSEDSYNITMYYEKYGLSARARYTWRSAFLSDDFGSTSSRPWGFPVVQEARGQLNASINYDVNDKLSIGVEAVNLTESDVEQSCVNEGALLCFQGLTDRRITFGGTYSF